MIIRPEIKEILVNGDKDDRLYLFAQNPLLFGIYYFPHYFTFKVADYQVDFFLDGKALVDGTYNEILWKAYRESAKTSIGKMLMVWMICFKKKHYLNVDAYDKGNSEAIVYDVAMELQTNRNLIADFGQLYNKQRRRKDVTDEFEETKIKRLSNFITENGVKVEAFSTQESTRGRLYKNKRPDFFWLDDIETSKTKDSPPVIQKIIGHVDEMRAGLGSTGSILYTGNFIIDDGVIAHIENRLRANELALVRQINVIMGGQPAWPDKYVMTDAEATEVNKDIVDRGLRKISLEQKRRDLTDKVFDTEMMNDPGRSDDYFFDRDAIKRLMKDCTEPKKTVGGLKLWAEYNPNHRYGMGGDTSEGNGGDANADVIISYSRKPNLVVASFQSNEVSPYNFGKAMFDHGNMFGGCLAIPEINNTGYATVARLIELNYTNVYQRDVKNQTDNRIKKDYGFRTTVGSRYEILSAFRDAVESGELVILDIDLLKECYAFKLADAGRMKNQEGVTRHFDKLFAAALAWEGRAYSTPSEKEGKNIFKSPLQGEYKK